MKQSPGFKVLIAAGAFALLAGWNPAWATHGGGGGWWDPPKRAPNSSGEAQKSPEKPDGSGFVLRSGA